MFVGRSRPNPDGALTRLDAAARNVWGVLGEPPVFALDTEELPGQSYIVRVMGELDLYTAPRLENELAGLAQADAAHVIVDLAESPFVDSSGLGVLLQAAGRLGSDRFALTGLGIEARRVFQITGADRLLTIVDLAPEASI
jgi:anti-sigma B factor antagonist